MIRYESGTQSPIIPFKRRNNCQHQLYTIQKIRWQLPKSALSDFHKSPRHRKWTCSHSSSQLRPPLWAGVLSPVPRKRRLRRLSFPGQNLEGNHSPPTLIKPVYPSLISSPPPFHRHLLGLNPPLNPPTSHKCSSTESSSASSSPSSSSSSSFLSSSPTNTIVINHIINQRSFGGVRPQRMDGTPPPVILIISDGLWWNGGACTMMYASTLELVPWYRKSRRATNIGKLRKESAFLALF